MKKLFAIMTVLILAMTACGSNNETGSTEVSSNKEVVSTASVVESPKNPFTGEDNYPTELLKKRPLAIMISNIDIALPQKGIKDAEIIYEMPVEGAITRLMAVFSDVSKLPVIGSVRSARHDFVELSIPLDSIYIHFGGSPAGKASIINNHVDAINGTEYSNIAFFQDEQRARTKGQEHSFFTNTELIANGIAKKEIRTELKNPLEPIFNFKAEATQNGTPTVEANLSFSGYCKAKFHYNETTAKYEKSQFNAPHIDANDNSQLATDNVFVLYTNIGLVSGTINKEIDLSQGEGFYMSKGKRVDMTWKKGNPKDKLQFFTTSGEALPVNTGKSYVCVIPMSEMANTTFQ